MCRVKAGLPGSGGSRQSGPILNVSGKIRVASDTPEPIDGQIQGGPKRPRHVPGAFAHDKVLTE